LTFEELERAQLILWQQRMLSRIVNKYVQFVKIIYLLFLYCVCCIITVNVRLRVVKSICLRNFYLSGHGIFIL